MRVARVVALVVLRRDMISASRLRGRSAMMCGGGGFFVLQLI